MKSRSERSRFAFGFSFWGTVFLSILSLVVGNSWITVFERAGIEFILLMLVVPLELWLIQYQINSVQIPSKQDENHFKAWDLTDRQITQGVQEMVQNSGRDM